VREFTIAVPGTIANLGPGFDTLGVAVTMQNELVFACDEPQSGTPPEIGRRLAETKLEMTIEGEGAGEIHVGRDNLVFRAAAHVFRMVGLAPKRIRLHLRNAIPLQRGLGSSAAAAVGGAVAANVACGNPLNTEALLQIVARIEGHPDNAAPALLGGLTVCLHTDEGFHALRFQVPDTYRIVLCIPEARVPTGAARTVLPREVSREDAVFSISRAAVLVGLLTSGAEEGLREAMRDRLHQPYRLPLVKGLADALEAALAAGALGAVLSGSGPTLAAFVPAGAAGLAERVGEAMVKALAGRGTAGRHCQVSIQSRGAWVVT